MKREQISEIASMEFTCYGVKRVSIDEIVQKMRISKKTLYELFGTKEQLAIEAFSYKSQHLSSKINKLITADNNAMYIIIRAGVENFKFFSAISSAFYDDLKLFPNLEKEVKGLFERSHNTVKEQIIKGIDGGLLSPDVNYELLGPLIKSQITTNLQAEAMGNYTPEQICRACLITIFKGVCTQKGRDLLDEIEKNED